MRGLRLPLIEALFYMGEHIKVLNVAHEIILIAKDLYDEQNYSSTAKEIVKFLDSVCSFFYFRCVIPPSPLCGPAYRNCITSTRTL